jgi:hypothetical protein
MGQSVLIVDRSREALALPLGEELPDFRSNLVLGIFVVRTNRH